MDKKHSELLLTLAGGWRDRKKVDPELVHSLFDHWKEVVYLSLMVL